MKRVLVVDDSVLDREIAAAQVAEALCEPIKATCGREALDVLANDSIDIVLADLNMPDINGLELVKTVTDRYPLLPIVLMTSSGSEETAVQALQSGAASYIPKRLLHRELKQTLRELGKLATAKRDRKRAIELIKSSESYFEIGYDRDAPAAVMRYLVDSVLAFGLCTERDEVRLGSALCEAIRNAVDHGNLELDSKMRLAGDHSYWDLGDDRKTQEPYRDRKVYISSRLTQQEATFVIRDEGPGYDPTVLPDPMNPENLVKPTGRGLLLMRTFMSEVTTNDRGNELTMVFRPKNTTPSTYDRAAALANVAGDIALLQETADMLGDESDACLTSMEAGLQSHDAKTVERAAHTLKSSLRLFCASDAADVARTLEAEAADGNLARCETLVGILKRKIDDLVAELTADRDACE